MTGAVFDMPAAPTEWDGSSLNLIRIIDPLGEAIAWFTPEHGACCAGYAVRQVNAPAHSETPWRDIVTGSTSVPTVTIRENDDDTTHSRWRFVERDPASCTLDWTRDSGSRSEHWQLTAALTDARLSLDLLIHNAGTEPIQTGACMHLVVSSPSGIVARLAGDASGGCPDDDTVQRNESRPIMLAVDADPGPGTVQTEVAREKTRCTISDHRLKDPVPIIEPGAFRRLSVVIDP